MALTEEEEDELKRLQLEELRRKSSESTPDMSNEEFMAREGLQLDNKTLNQYERNKFEELRRAAKVGPEEVERVRRKHKKTDSVLAAALGGFVLMILTVLLWFLWSVLTA